MSVRRIRIWFVFFIGVALVNVPAMAAPLHENLGTITSLVASGASTPGDPIQVSSSVRADSVLQVSNLSYELFDPDGIRVDTRTVTLGGMGAGETASDSWTSYNTPSKGTYTVSLCWSTGNAQNCNVTSASTSFYSVPTLGWGLSLFALGLLGLWLWRQHEEFQPVLE